MPIDVVNPATGELLESFEELEPVERARAIERAEECFSEWCVFPVADRARVLYSAAAILRDEKREHAEWMARRMGKPVTEGTAEIEKCAWVCEHYAEHAEEMLASELVAIDDVDASVRFDPLGPVLAIMPWNFPYWQVFRFLAPALMAGNVALLKHASNVIGCGRAIEDVLERANLPGGCFQSLALSSRTASDLIGHPSIRAVTLTGSEAAGRSVAERAGRALKKTVLELGGSDPFIVLDDADVVAVARSAAQARMQNSGQSCIAAKRFIVATALYDDFADALVSELAAARVGDPLDPETQVGPLAREDLRDTLHGLVESSIRAGAKLLLGGYYTGERGFFYAPTVLKDVAPGMAAFDEETFGPVAALTSADTDAEAIALANCSRYGLGASIWTADPERARRYVPELEAGNVAVNTVVKSDPRLPFGGVKRSGYGRELGTFGIREFVNVKSVSSRAVTPS
jgi:succinate-semialdehyde dehydrogenase / glutarate-semialdehyde dehydrogenase